MKRVVIIVLLMFCLQTFGMDNAYNPIPIDNIIQSIYSHNRNTVGQRDENHRGINAKYHGFTLLQHAVMQNRLDLLTILFANNQLEPNIKCDKGKSALSYAVALGNSDMIRLFLKDLRVDVNCQDDDDELTPLHYAATFEETDILELLLNDSRINPNICTQGCAPYHLAYKSNNWKAFAMLSPRTSFFVKHRDKCILIGLIVIAYLVT